ncbi:MAG: Maf-like protein [marine bacterium B5-7]|nr:MAG: Maf-like protein [marine bacterium B5-7]
MKSPYSIVLASSSPFRRELLARSGLEFECESPEIDESPRPNESPEDLVTRLSVAKALKVAEGRSGTLVIGSDQVAEHAGIIVGKPADHDEAIRHLLSASGNRITLYTGLALHNTETGRTQTAVDPFYVTFREIDREIIERYLAFEKPYNCCGSVKAEGAGISLIRSLSGNDPNSLIGLPMIRLCEMLNVEGVTLF